MGVQGCALGSEQRGLGSVLGDRGIPRGHSSWGLGNRRDLRGESFRARLWELQGGRWSLGHERGFREYQQDCPAARLGRDTQARMGVRNPMQGCVPWGPAVALHSHCDRREGPLNPLGPAWVASRPGAAGCHLKP